ncbi:MAG: hypothetical protein JWP66_820 [Naasia sp.]|nr:hypothetical protein [Naasia sp.]
MVGVVTATVCVTGMILSDAVAGMTGRRAASDRWDRWDEKLGVRA